MIGYYLLGGIGCFLVLLILIAVWLEYSSSVKIHTRTTSSPPVQPFPSRSELSRLTFRERSVPFTRSMPMTSSSLYRVTVVYDDGQIKVFCCLTLSQALARVEVSATTGRNIILSRERSLRHYSKKELSSHSSDQSQDGSKSTSQMTSTTESSVQAIPPQEGT